MISRPSQCAFSLVELSIVLVILGLLTGGILAGQSLIRASELRAVTTEATRWVAASQTFRDKYFALPGDMGTATQFWMPVGGNSTDNWTTSCYPTITPGTASCNGNANGLVDDINERYRHWQHLSSTGLIEGQFNGDAVGALQRQVNVPASKIGNAAWVLNYLPNFAGSANYLFAGDYGHMLQLRDPGAAVSIIKAEEAWNIDTKMDDGRPATGKVFSSFGTTFAAVTCANATGVTDTSATYNLVDGGKNCSLFFLRAF